MLKKTYRLSSVKISNPKNLSSPLFNIKISKNQLGFSRFGFVISKKLDTRATARNSLKRKLSTSIEEIFDRIEIGWDFVFYPRSIAKSAPKARITEELVKILAKEGLTIND